MYTYTYVYIYIYIFPMLDLSTEMAPPSQLKRAKNSGSADEQLVKWWHDFVTLTSDVSDIEEI